MARQPNAPVQGRDGKFRCWHPVIKKTVSLQTTSYDAACEIQRSFYEGQELPQSLRRTLAEPLVLPRMGSGQILHPPQPAPTTRSAPVIDFDANAPSLDANDLLASWARTNPDPSASPDGPSKPVAASAPIPAPDPPSAGVLSTWFNPVAPKPSRQKPGLTPEQSAKIAAGLKKTVTNVNVIVVGAAVQMFGRVPAPLDDEEVALLQLGWEMYIDEMFSRAKIKPWHLLLAGNVMIAAAMYVGGTPVKKLPPPGDPSKQAKSFQQPATITPITPPVKS